MRPMTSTVRKPSHAPQSAVRGGIASRSAATTERQSEQRKNQRVVFVIPLPLRAPKNSQNTNINTSFHAPPSDLPTTWTVLTPPHATQSAAHGVAVTAVATEKHALQHR